MKKIDPVAAKIAAQKAARLARDLPIQQAQKAAAIRAEAARDRAALAIIEDIRTYIASK